MRKCHGQYLKIYKKSDLSLKREGKRLLDGEQFTSGNYLHFVQLLEELTRCDASLC